MEHILCKHILNHTDKNKILTMLQHGFRHGYSCETQLLLTIHDLMTYNNRKNQIDILILDFSKAFDTVPHDKLIHKMNYYGIRGNILKWIGNFLKRREQRVVIEGKNSKWIHVDSGVPQGTVLGPLLFLLYINDITECVSSGTKMRLFADDCIIYRTIKSIHDQIILQRGLDRLKQWADKWGMRFNPSKCQVMRISRSKTPHEKYYLLCNQILEQVSKAKYLGVLISDDLKWSPHVDYISGKASKVLGLLQRNLHHCPQEIREIAYLSMVRSILEYACAVWDPYLKKDTCKLERIQRKAARFVKNDYRVFVGNPENREYASVTQMISELGWQSLEKRRRETRLALLYKIVHHDVNIKQDEIENLILNNRGVQTNEHKCPKFTRFSWNILQYKNSFTPRTVCDWNNLSCDIACANNVETFKHRLKTPASGQPA